jgi:hypothetical protein
MIRKLIAIAALVFGSPVAAQEWSGPGAQPVVYSTHTLLVGNAPAADTAPADIPTTGSTAGMITSGGEAVNTSGGELKFRVWCMPSHENDQDAILAKGQDIGPHRHSYVGANSTNKDASYQTLRNSSASTCAGNKLFTQGYWEPSVCKTVGTMWQCLKPDNALFYYARPREELGTLTSLPAGTAFITGFNRSPAFYAARSAEVPTGYTNDGYDGFLGWSCLSGNGTIQVKAVGNVDMYPAFQTPSGTDPWEGRCLAGYVLQANLTAPQCWDRQNRTSPDGRGHFRFMIRNNNDNQEYCPDNWSKVPDLIVRFRYSLKKTAEYMTDQWFLSSDRMDANPANWYTPGRTMHADWMFGADPDVWHTIMAKCLGIPSPGYTAVGGDCGTYSIGDGRVLSYPGFITDGYMYARPAKQRWWPLKPAIKWTQMIHGH